MPKTRSAYDEESGWSDPAYRRIAIPAIILAVVVAIALAFYFF